MTCTQRSLVENVLHSVCVKVGYRCTLIAAEISVASFYPVCVFLVSYRDFDASPNRVSLGVRPGQLQLYPMIVCFCFVEQQSRWLLDMSHHEIEQPV